MLNSRVAIGPWENVQRTHLGDVLMYEGEMVVLKNYSMFNAHVEYEDGTRKWVSREELSLI
jgi:hypothetical protein